MITLIVLFIATFFLAYSNGANDNFKFGLPVSTTQVSVGSLFGIGLITREANRRVVSGILMSWLLTLPIAAILSAVIYAIVSL